MRGKRSIHSRINPPQPRQPRRRNYQLPERNVAIAHRYYYYDCMHRLRYEKIIHNICREFYLSESRVIAVLRQDDLLSMILNWREANLGVKELRIRYPHFTWDAPAQTTLY